MKYDSTSRVEEIFLEKSGFDFRYAPCEKMDSIIVGNFPLLGKITALRFIEWVQKNPGGVVSLPTGKTPEHFIKWARHYLSGWGCAAAARDLEAHGIDVSVRPDISSLYFVQIDEFYPVLPNQENSFYSYIEKFYMGGFGFDREKALLMDASKTGIPRGYSIENIFPGYTVDLSLRTRYPKTHIEALQKDAIFAVDEYCVKYEKRIRELGGIGFFMGGIGPDGHIGFNVSGSSFFSCTRLASINYETAAAASTDLGGIEISRNRPVITIGLATISLRRDVTAIVTAAGDGKAKITADSIQQPATIKLPATVLHDIPSARFYLTRSAASRLEERNYLYLKEKKEISSDEIRHRTVDLGLRLEKKIEALSADDFMEDRLASLVVERTGKSVEEIKKSVKADIEEAVSKGSAALENTAIFHTAPHHDDEFLGYLPYLARLARAKTNTHYFCYMTSGFTSVTNRYVLKLFENLKYFLKMPYFSRLVREGCFSEGDLKSRNRDIYYYLDGIASDKMHLKNEALAGRLVRIMSEVFGEPGYESISDEADKILNYLVVHAPGTRDEGHIQKIKGMVREFEAELALGYFGFDASSVFHLRSAFYTGDIFTPQPEMDSDVGPVADLLRKVSPDLVTVAFDPEGSGPDTHYKVLQTVAEALKIFRRESGKDNIRVLGYRNVWHRFDVSDANIIVPGSLNNISILNHAFLNCFGSQRDASFPSHDYDGPFSKLAQKIYVQQYSMVKTLLGKEYFFENESPLLRAARALVFLKEMSLEEFCCHARELKESIETT